jgi:hypothetical protein
VIPVIIIVGRSSRLREMVLEKFGVETEEENKYQEQIRR